MREHWESFWRDEDGQALSEYTLIIMVVGLGAIGVLYAFRKSIKEWFDKYIRCVNDPNAAGCSEAPSESGG